MKALSESLDRQSVRHSSAEQRSVEFDAFQVDLHTALPGIIQSYDNGTKRGTVQLLPRRLHLDQNVAIPQLVDVPIQQPSAGRLYLGFEPRPGDEVLVIFAEREIGSAKRTGAEYNLANARMHNLSDGLAIPFCFSDGQASRLANNGVSLLECFEDLVDLVRQVAASNAGSTALVPQIQAIAAKIESTRL